MKKLAISCGNGERRRVYCFRCGKTNVTVRTFLFGEGESLGQIEVAPAKSIKTRTESFSHIEKLKYLSTIFRITPIVFPL